MPTSCANCDLAKHFDGYNENDCPFNCFSYYDCPLIPVPPHGRLIDADGLLMRINHEVMEAYMDGVCYGVHPNQEYLYLLGEIIDDAPTIIPASKEGKT